MNTMSYEWIAILVLLAILVPFIFYLVTLQRTLAAIAIESRMMHPGQVWLLFVPLFNIVWQFIVVSRMADSIKNECLRLNIPAREERPTFTLGLTMTLLYLASLVLNQSSIFPLLGSTASLAALVCWIIYWVRINKYRNLIIASQDNFLLDVEREAMQNES